MGGLVATYQLGAIAAALDRGDVAAAEEYWSSVSAMEARTTDAAGRRAAVKTLIAHAALDLARHDTTAASQHIARASSLVPEVRRGSAVISNSGTI